MSVLAAERRRVTVFCSASCLFVVITSVRSQNLCFSHHWQHTTSAGSCRSGLGFWYQSCGGLCQDHKSQPLDQILIQFTARFIRTTSLCKINFNTAFATPPLFSKRLLNALQAVSTKIKRIVVSLVWTTHNTRAWSVVKGDHISSFDTNRQC